VKTPPSRAVQNLKIRRPKNFILHYVPKKETKMFSVISVIKLGRFWWTLVHSFLNKFAAKLCKRFPPHLNNDSTLPCETWKCSLCTCYRWVVTEEIQEEFIPPQLCLSNSPDLNPVDHMWKKFLKKVCKTRVTSLELSVTPVINAKNWKKLLIKN